MRLHSKMGFNGNCAQIKHFALQLAIVYQLVLSATFQVQLEIDIFWKFDSIENARLFIYAIYGKFFLPKTFIFD